MRHWKNFDVELFDHDNIGDSESVRVRVARSPAGSQREARRIEIPVSLHARAKALSAGTHDMQQTIELGQVLAGILFAGEANDLLANSRAGLQGNEGLRIRIELRSLALADLPWEYIYQTPSDADSNAPERGFLALDRSLSIVRYEPVAEASGSCAPLAGKPMQVTMLLANPDIPGWATLNLEREIRAVKSALDDEPDIELKVHKKANNQALNDTLDNNPHVFHFAGHGRFKLQPSEKFGVYMGQGELLFETDDGKPEPVNANTLANKMRGSEVRLAVLNNCESARRDTLNAFTGVAPTLVREGVPAVVAMQYHIRDQHAITFARRLYTNLAQHKSIDSAVAAARIAMFKLDNKYTRDWGIPVLYLRSDQTILFPDREAIAPELGKLGRLGGLNVALGTLMAIAAALFYAWHLEPRLPHNDYLWGLVLAGIVAAAGFVKFLAGDSLRATLLHWFRRKTATITLASTLTTMVLVGFILPRPVMVRVIPGKTLIGLLATGDFNKPLQRQYELSVDTGNNIATNNDFRKSGTVVAANEQLAFHLNQHYETEVVDSIDRYIEAQNLGQRRDNYLGFWQNQPASLAVKSLGKVKQFNISLSQAGATVACQKVDIEGNTTVVILEKSDEC